MRTSIAYNAYKFLSFGKAPANCILQLCTSLLQLASVAPHFYTLYIASFLALCKTHPYNAESLKYFLFCKFYFKAQNMAFRKKGH